MSLFRRRTIRQLPIVLGLLSLSACDSATSTSLGPPAPIDVSSVVVASTEVDVVAARSMWLSSRPASYVFEYYRLGGFENRNRYRIRVQDDVAVEAVFDPFGEPVDVYESIQVSMVPHSTLDALYEEAMDGFEQDADSVAVEYLPVNALPARVTIDRLLQAGDDETTLIVTGFEVE